jgi:hypothetical protein
MGPAESTANWMTARQSSGDPAALIAGPSERTSPLSPSGRGTGSPAPTVSPTVIDGRSGQTFAPIVRTIGSPSSRRV